MCKITISNDLNYLVPECRGVSRSRDIDVLFFLYYYRFLSLRVLTLNEKKKMKSICGCAELKTAGQVTAVQ